MKVSFTRTELNINSTENFLWTTRRNFLITMIALAFVILKHSLQWRGESIGPLPAYRNLNKVSLIIVARCTFGGDQDNGFAVRNAFFKRMVKHGVQIVYRCFIHYTLIGSATQECNNGQWKNARPSCKGKYPLWFQDVRVVLPCSHTKISQLMAWDRQLCYFLNSVLSIELIIVF